jgi:hypothetical protein
VLAGSLDQRNEVRGVLQRIAVLCIAQVERALPFGDRHDPDHRVTIVAAGVDERRAVRRELGLQRLAGPESCVAGALVVDVHASDLRGLARGNIEDIEPEKMPAVQRLVSDPRAVGDQTGDQAQFGACVTWRTPVPSMPAMKI